MIDKNKLDSQLMLDEGLRLIAYKDTKGLLTIGVGRNLDGNPLTPDEIARVGHDGRSQPITMDGAMYLLHNDEMKVFKDLGYQLPWWNDLDDVRGRVLADLCFNMGINKLMGFHTFLGLLRAGSFQEAADDLQGTAWYGQVGQRGPRLVGMVATGEDYTS